MILDNLEDDYQYFLEDEVGYMTEMYRRQAEHDAAFSDYMGIEFAIKPLPLRSELESEAKHLSSQLAALHRLKAPDELTLGFQEELGKVMTQLNSGAFSTTKSELEYHELYHKKANEFIYESKG